MPATTEEESEAGSPAQTRRRGKARAAVRAQEEAKPAEEALEAEATADVAETEEAPSKTAAGPARYSLRKRPSSTLAVSAFGCRDFAVPSPLSRNGFSKKIAFFCIFYFLFFIFLAWFRGLSRFCDL